MRFFQSSIFRALCAIIIGVLILRTPDSTVEYLTIAIGILFLISGVISCLGWYNTVKNYEQTKIIGPDGQIRFSNRPVFPIVGLGSIILGFILALMPGSFVKSLMYVLATLVILGALNQLMALISARKFCSMGAGYWVMPTLLLLAGIFIFVKPLTVAATPLIIIGICLIVYGVSEFINSLVIHNRRKQAFNNLPVERGEYVDYTEET